MKNSSSSSSVLNGYLHFNHLLTRIAALLMFVLLIGGNVVWGQSIFDNPITGSDPNTSNPYVTGQSVNANITVSGIGRGTGITGTNANNRYNANSWSTSTIDLNDYFEFTISPNSGYFINFISFVYNSQISTGSANHAFRSSRSFII